MAERQPVRNRNGRRVHPPDHTSCWELTKLFRDDHAPQRAVEASGRLLEFAAGLEPGAHLSLVLGGDGTGAVTVRLHTDTTTQSVPEFLPWITEGLGTWTEVAASEVHLVDPARLESLFELVPSVQYSVPAELDIGLMRELGGAEPVQTPDLWPIGVVDDGMELLKALRGLSAQVRVHMAPATLLEQQMIASQTRRSVQSSDPVAYARFMGTPLRIRCFVGQAGPYLSPRIRAALMRFGLGLVLVPRDLQHLEHRDAWDADELSLAGAVQPFGVAQCLARLPASGEQAEVCGVPTGEADAPLVPLTVESAGAGAGLRLGSAVSPTGAPMDVRVSMDDLLLHTQVLGATGTGKSTLLAGLVQEAVAADMGVSVIDPHGTLVQRILQELPRHKRADLVVARSGDLNHPVPVNVLSGPRSEMLTDMMVQVMKDLFDPRSEGFLGPRFERAYGTAIAVLRNLLGARASLSAIPLVFRSQDDLRALVPAVARTDPVLAKVLSQEFGRLGSDQYADLTAWVNSKFQRLVATPEMRAVLGTGEDAVDMRRVFADRKVLLVDLALPVLGPLGAQLLGEMWLAKHWAAIADRARDSRPHLLIVDEAHLFASGLLPRLLAEARKFGVGVVLAHQHLEQLAPELREATLATTSNVIVFRSGPREAVTALTRLGDWGGGSLTRLPRLQASATLSQGLEQTDAFTLVVDHNQRTSTINPGEQDLGGLEFLSRSHYSEPFRVSKPVTADDLDAAVQGRRVASPGGEGGTTRDPKMSGDPSGPSFLDDWLAKRKQELSGLGDEPPTDGEQGDQGGDDV